MTEMHQKKLKKKTPAAKKNNNLTHRDSKRDVTGKQMIVNCTVLLIPLQRSIYSKQE